MTEVKNNDEEGSSPPEVVNYQSERRKVVITIGVLLAWVCFVLATVNRSNAVALTSENLSIDYVAPLLGILLMSIVFIVIACLPSTLKSEHDEEEVVALDDKNSVVNMVQPSDNGII
ncbi:uncharacterized protein LOC124291633 [Haliotis rubra]|uniref:uncharacterized protein LOC124291633 n=1 Tax=Haliotis rubra TaxID=36100 RepID=UPI001EE610BB|nr:uncharacterized protein LOC124291633 [Haliotis rubra]